jgi:hypothetical protein
VVLHRVVCCYPGYARLLAAAADHARRGLVVSSPPRNLLSCAFYRGFNLVMRLMRSGFSGLAHPPGAMLAVLEDHGLRRIYQGRSRIWQVAGLERVSYERGPRNSNMAVEVGVPTGDSAGIATEQRPTALAATWPEA